MASYNKEIRYSSDNDYHNKIRVFLGNQIHYHLTGSSKLDKKIAFLPDVENLDHVVLTTENHLKDKYQDIMQKIKGVPKSDFDNKMIDNQLIDEYCPYELSIHQSKNIKFYFDDILMEVRIEIFDKELAQNYRSADFYSTVIITSENHKKIVDFVLYVDEYIQNTNINTKGINYYKSIGDDWICMGLAKRRKLDTVYLPKKDLELLCQDIDKFMKPTTEKLYTNLCINYKRTFLLEGVPGSGKTSLISAIATKYNYHICCLNFCKADDYNLEYLVKNLPEKSLFVIEDFDALIQDRKDHDSSRNNITFTGLLSMLDGILMRRQTIIFITTNHKKSFDPALLRPGRIDYVMTFEHCTQEQIGDMYLKYMSMDINTGETSIDATYLEEVNKNKKPFVKAVMSLGIPITCSLLQQYLFKYLGEISDAIGKVKEIKEFHDSLPNDNEHTKLYS
jgi:SpoVK/Ycf46/Vps4 family AAA+-type ATPase